VAAGAILVAFSVLLSAAVIGGRELWREHPTVLSIGESPRCGTDPMLPKRQFRGMWLATVANLDWPSRPGLKREVIQAEYRAWLDIAERNRFNAVVVQVRDAGGVFWPSRLEPWSQYLTGTRGRDPGWDPMEFLVAETHRRGLAFHAWINPYRASALAADGAGNDPELLPRNHPLRAHPDWAVSYPRGKTGRLYYDPGEPAARRFVEDVVLEVVRRYDVDAIHFDDFFYPYRQRDEEFPDSATFKRHGGGFDDLASWRRNNTDLLISETHHRIRSLKPWVRFGVSPLAIWRNASEDPLGSATSGAQSYQEIFADTRKWVREEWLDYIVPQLYWPIGFAAADYMKLVPWWAEVVAGTNVHLYVGQAAYKPGAAGWHDPDELVAHLTLNQRYPQVRGDVYFRARDVRADRNRALSRAVERHYRGPALLPAWGNQRASRPAVTITSARRQPAGGAAVAIEWRDPVVVSGGEHTARSYAVYRFEGGAPTTSCAFATAAYLLGTTAGNRFTDRLAEPGHRYTYFVTAVDRQLRECPPSQARTVR
jgi:uncharacterized lipoprotein YddW (UPF0748 family)